LADLDIEAISLGTGRPAIDEGKHLSRPKAILGVEEASLFRDAIAAARPDHALHLHADPTLRWLARGPESGAPISILLFRPRAHYLSAYGSALSLRERLAAQVLEFLVCRWRRRGDSHAILTLDEGAIEHWHADRGARAYWLPEPPTLSEPPEARVRLGCAMFGALAQRKGIDLLANAIALEPTDMRVVLAGVPESSYRDDLNRHVAAMRDAGARVELRDWWHTEEEKLDVLAGARCSVAPYNRHFGMSRILVESAAVGTPVVADEFGLVGHLVREHGIGVAVDCHDARALRAALLKMTYSEHPARQHAAQLRTFAARYSARGFESVLQRVFLREE
jgi:glycosyltransferase involved in cell wall biosynthesis